MSSVCRFGVQARAMNVAMITSKVKAVLIDLSGTLHIGDTVVPGAQEALKRLRGSKLKIKFLTNTTKEPRRTLHMRLSALGFDICKNDLFTSLIAARNVVLSKGVRPMFLLEDSAKEDFEGIDIANPNAVVVGLSPNSFNYDPMNEAFRYLARNEYKRLLLEGAQLIAIHKARYYKKSDGLYLGPGGFVSALEYATDVKAQVVGKPEVEFFHEAIRDLGVTPEEAFMIGDDVRDDVRGAQNARMRGILVQTGKYRDGDEHTISPKPFATCRDFSAAVDLILRHVGDEGNPPS